MVIQSNIPEMLSYKRCSNCLKFILLTVFVLFFQVLKAQDFTGLDATLEQHKKIFGGKMAIVVWKDTTLYAKAVGEDMTVNTQVPVGCASAWMAAALVMTFVDQGKISLDDPVAKYLPIYEKYAKGYLTIRHCLANTTGLQGEKGGIEKIFQKTKFESLEDQVNSFASSREIINNPGEVFSYNNIGTNIAARVIEVVGKKSFDRLMTERIFRPLGMKKSTFTSEVAVNPFSGGLVSPADYVRFLAMLLNKGVGNGKKILSEESVAELFKMQTGAAKIIYVPGPLQGYQYGLGNWIAADGTGIHTSPGLTGGWPYINVQKKYACMIFGIPKDKKEKDDKSWDVYKEIVGTLESRF